MPAPSALPDALKKHVAGLKNNDLYLDVLGEQIRRSKIVPFVGAGLSVPIQFPTWRDFLVGLAEGEGIETKVSTLLYDGLFEEAAQLVVATVGKSTFDLQFRQSFGSHRIDAYLDKKGGFTGPLLHLPRLATGPVVTTNYDRVLERCFKEADRSFEKVCWGNQSAELSGSFGAAMRLGTRVLLKIHGDVLSTPSRILTVKEYEKIYDINQDENSEHSNLPELLKILFSSHIILFLGCSLDTDRTVPLLAKAAKIIDGLGNFAILELPDSDDAYQKKRHFLDQHGINPIWFPPGRFELIGDIVAYLANIRMEAGETKNMQALPSNRTDGPGNRAAFFGRELELDEICAFLRGHQRLLTLTGIGGCGKTRLAEEVARRMAPYLPDPAITVHLAEECDPEIVPQAIARACNIQEQARRPPTEALTDFLANKQLILILDNCEHLLDACRLMVEELLNHCPRLRILVTSRKALKISSEQRYPLKPLRVPRDSAPGVEQLLKNETVAMLVDRVKRIEPSFSLGPGNIDDIVAICQGLAGIPLAIELVAPRLHWQAASDIRADLDNQMQLLQGEDSTTRHTSMQAALEASFQHLSQDAKQLLCIQSVFTGTIEEEALTSISALARPTIHKLMRELIDHSLLSVDMGENHRRLYLLEPIRQFAAHKLADTSQAATVQQAHAHWFVAFMQLHGPTMLGDGAAAVLDTFAMHHSNLRASMEHLIGQQEWIPALHLAAQIWRFWEIRGYLTEAGQRLQRLIDCTEALPPTDEIAALRSKVIEGRGMIAYRSGDATLAKRYFHKALRIENTRSPLDQQRIATCTNDLGLAEQISGHYPEARTFFEKSLELQREHGTDREIAVSYFNAGNTAYRCRDYASAKAYLQNSFQKFISTGNERESGFPLTTLGLVCIQAGELDKAETYIQSAIDIRRKLGDKSGEGDSLTARARLHMARQQLPAARKDLHRSLELLRQVDAKKGQVETIEAIALVCASAGLAADALRCSRFAEQFRTKHALRRSPIEQAEQDDCVQQSEAQVDAQALLRIDASRPLKDMESVLALMSSTSP